MRIIGGQDYYDSALVYGRDPHIIFDRTGKEDFDPENHPKVYEFTNRNDNLRFNEQLSEKAAFERRPRYSYEGFSSGRNRHIINLNNNLSYSYQCVMFCGKLYSAFVFFEENHGNRATHTCWSVDELVNFLKKHKLSLDLEHKNHAGNKQIERLKFFFENVDVSEFMIENNMTILTYEYVSGAYNKDKANLKQLQFYKVFDAFSAMQELSMWVGGVLARPSKPMVKIIDEKILVKKHGFDKHSFRHPFK